MDTFIVNGQITVNIEAATVIYLQPKNNLLLSFGMPASQKKQPQVVPLYHSTGID
jgi:hypothetical protein